MDPEARDTWERWARRLRHVRFGNRAASTRNDPAPEFLQDVRPEARWIVRCTLLFVVVMLLWASRAPIDEVAVGQGQVIPSGRVQVVQNLEGGIISEILIVPGQKVRKDQALMKIDDKRFASSYREGEARNLALRARIARLEAESMLQPFRPPADLVASDPTLVQQERQVYESRRRDMDSGLAVLRQQAEQRRQESAEMRARVERLRHGAELVQQELAMVRPAAEKGVVPKVDLIRIERQANDLEGELQQASLALPRLQAAERETRQRIEQYVAEFRAQASRELSEVRAEQAIVSANKVALEDRLERTVVRASVTGVVKRVMVNTVGGVVQPGMDLVELVPADDDLLVEARLRPADIAFVRPGLEATIKLSAYDFSIYGGIEGTVEHVSADAIVEDYPGTNSQAFYVVRVRTQRQSHDAHGTRIRILPGMQATVDIRTGRRTVLQYLLKPILRAKQTALRER